MANKKFSDYVVAGDNITLTYDNNADTVTIDAAGNVDSVNGQTGVVVLNKTDIGLGNVDNTSDVNKPISTATQTALNGKQDTLVSGTNIKTVNSNSLVGSGDVVIDKTSIGLGNVTNVDTTNASNISSGTLSDSRLSTNVTTQGNTFNAANKLVQLDATAKLPAVDGSQLTNLPSFTPPNGLLKIASAISTTFQAVTDYLGNASVLFLNSRRIGIGKDTSVTTQSVAVVEVQDANTSIVLKPNGTGAIIASVPDGTATGGNARGSYAVDLQMRRNASDQVAGFIFDTITGGENNKISPNFDGYRFIGGGYQNTISVAGYSTIAGGRQNSISGGGSSYQTISGGLSNINSSTYGVISGGQSNTASTNTHATVVGGQSNTSSGNNSISGGFANTASAFGAVALGRNNTASNQYAVALGGYSQATATYCTALNGGRSIATFSFSSGDYSYSYLLGQSSFCSGSFYTQLGDAQQSLLTASRQAALTTAATTVLSLDGTGTTNLIIPNGNNRAWNVQIDTIAVVTAITGTATGVSVGDTYSEVKNLLFKRIGGTSSIVGTVDTSFIKSNAGMSTAALTVTAGASQQMALTFTAPTFAGGGSVTCRVVSKVSLVEVAY